MAWTQHIDWTPDEEDALDAALVALGYATAEDLAEARAIPLSVSASDTNKNTDQITMERHDESE